MLFYLNKPIIIIIIIKTRLPVVLPFLRRYVEIQQWPLPLQEFQGRVLLPDAVLDVSPSVLM